MEPTQTAHDIARARADERLARSLRASLAPPLRFSCPLSRLVARVAATRRRTGHVAAPLGS